MPFRDHVCFFACGAHFLLGVCFLFGSGREGLVQDLEGGMAWEGGWAGRVPGEGWAWAAGVERCGMWCGAEVFVAHAACGAGARQPLHNTDQAKKENMGTCTLEADSGQESRNHSNESRRNACF